MTPRTLAGRALLADPTTLTDDGEEAAEEAIDAIEEQAAQQERERIAALFEPINLALEERHTNPEWITNLGRAVRRTYDAILAEPSE